MNVTIAGASGFIGRNLIKRLTKEFKVRGLSRNLKAAHTERLEWAQCDLFSLSSTTKALENTDIAIYLVHSMMPSSRLFQGNFQDTDILLADNFGRACERASVAQIIYVGGLVPSQDTISKHLESRREVEDVLKSTLIPVTALRAGMVVGEGGASFELLKNLVFNLPFMVLPKWTQSQTQAIYIDDIVEVIYKSLNNTCFYNKTIDVVNGESLNYKDLIELTAKHFNKKRLFLDVPIHSTSFSKLWVTIFGKTNYELVSPLVDSLMCDLPNSFIDPLIHSSIHYKSYRQMLGKVARQTFNRKKSMVRCLQGRSVRSIQRLPNPHQFKTGEISQEYINWLPTHMRHLIRAKSMNDTVNFYAIGLRFPLLKLKRIPEQENIDRVKFHIIGGLLSKTTDTGCLEFRQIANGKYTLSSVHGFIPALPWLIYKYTQAPMHAAVMKAFGKFLSRRKAV